MLALGIDLTEDDAPSRIVKATVERFGSIDMLVNCAGIFPSTPALEISRNEWDRVFERKPTRAIPLLAEDRPMGSKKRACG